MANSAQAKKRVKQADKAHARNASQRSSMRSTVKKVLRSINENNHEEAQKNYKYASTLLDRAAGKGLIHKNKAARLKSRINAKIKSMAQ